MRKRRAGDAPAPHVFFVIFDKEYKKKRGGDATSTTENKPSPLPLSLREREQTINANREIYVPRDYF
jgi:hypothetical protein